MYSFYQSRFYQSCIHRFCIIAGFLLSQTTIFAQALPDITVSNLVLNLTSVIPNQTQNYFFDLKNIGTGAATVSFGYQAYLSTDNVLSANDINAGIFPTGTAPTEVIAGFSRRLSLYYIPQTTTPSGNYFIILKADPNNLVRESNENNNTTVSTTTFTILPNPPAADLTLANLNISTPSVLAGQTINYKVDLKNLGRNTPTDFIVNAYLSTDNVLTNTDPRIGGFAATSMGSAQVITQLPASATVPSTFAAGQYYLILKIDANTQVNELDEDNNVLASAAPITITTTTTGGTYCASKAATPWEMWVSNVTFGTINNTSQQFKDIAKAGYSDYTNLSTNVTKGQVYPIQIASNVSWFGNIPNTFCRVWIDFNKNDVFEDNEKVIEKAGNNSFVGSVTIPASAVIGAVRMRVAVKFGGYPTQCEAFEKGEVEDYTLNITGGTVNTDKCLNKFVLSTYSNTTCRYSGTPSSQLSTLDQYGQNIADGFMLQVNFPNNSVMTFFTRSSTTTAPLDRTYTNCSGNWLYFNTYGTIVFKTPLAGVQNNEFNNFIIRVRTVGSANNPDSIYVDINDNTSLVSISKRKDCNTCYATDVTAPVFTNCPTTIQTIPLTTSPTVGYKFSTLNAFLNIGVTDNCPNNNPYLRFDKPEDSRVTATWGATERYNLVAFDSAGHKSVCNFSVLFAKPTITGTSNITLAITSTPSVYQQYTTHNFKITATNSGTTVLSNVNITFPFPAKTANGGTATPSVGSWREWCAGGVQCFTWTIPSLAANATATLTVPLYVVDPTAPIIATAKLLSSTPAATSNTATITVNRAVATQAPASQALAFRVPSQLIPVVIQQIAPNPTLGDVQIKLDSWTKQTVDFNFSDITGKTIYSESRVLEKGLNQLNFEVFHLPQGVYFIQTTVGEGKDVPTKFVKM